MTVAAVNPDGTSLTGGRGAIPSSTVAVINGDGTPVRVGIDNFVPADQSMAAWSYDPIFAGTTWNVTAALSGIIYLQEIHVFGNHPAVQGVSWGLSSKGDTGTATTGNLIGLYGPSGTGAVYNLLAQTADLGTILTTAAGEHDSPWTSGAISVPQGTYYIAQVFNGTWSNTVPTMKATGGGSTTTARLSAPNLRLANMLTGQTSLPATLNMANQTTTAITGGAMSSWYGLYQ